MRVLVIHEHVAAPGEGGGGAESLLRDLSTALKGLGHEVAWWNGRSGSVQQAVAQFRPDIVQLQTLHNFLPGWLDLARWVQDNVPHVWAVMDYWPFCHQRMLLTGGVSGHGCAAVQGTCDGHCTGRRSPAEWLATVNRSPVVAYNEHTAAIYRRHGLRCDYVVELGVDTERFAPDHSQRTPQSSVWASSAWPEYPVKGFKVLQEAVKGTGIAVNYMAHTTRANIAKGLKRAHIYVFPSIYEETFGLSLCEAMASGCACIASDVAGARAQIHEGLGMLVPPGDARSLWMALKWLHLDPTAQKEWGERARAHVLQDHTLEAMGRRWLAVYQSVIGG